MEQHAHELVPGLWLGDAVAAVDSVWLAARRVRVVCNCTRDVPFHALIAPACRLRVPVDDNGDPAQVTALAVLAQDVLGPLLRARREGSTVLIHCYAGRQRSAALAAMLLLTEGHAGSAAEAMALVRARRSVAFAPCANFGAAVVAWERWCADRRAAPDYG